MIAFKYGRHQVPTYALSYLINGDSSGISQEEKERIDSYMAEMWEEATQTFHHKIHSMIFNPESEPFCSKWNDLDQMAGEVINCEITVICKQD